MAVQLFGDPFNLQGGGGNLQAAANPMQTGNPQQAYAPAPPVSSPAPKPAAAPKPKVQTFAAPVSAPTAQPVQIDQRFSQYVQTRPSPSNPGVLEYYNPQNGRGFASPNDVFNYLRTMTGQSFNDLKQLEAGYGANPVGNGGAVANPGQSLAQFAGMAGLGYEDYLKIVEGQHKLSQAEKDQIKVGLGIPDLEAEIFKPAPSTQKLYEDAYKSAGLKDLKTRIESKLSEIDKARSDFTNAKGEVDENPWLSEASRVGRGRILAEQAELKIGNLSGEVESLKSLYNAGVNEVNNLVTRQATDFSANQQLNSLKLTYLQQKAEEQITNKQNEKLSTAYSYLPDFLASKVAAQKPDTIGSAETGYYRWNPSTGTFEQVIGPQIDPYKQLQMIELQQKISGGQLTTEQKNKVASINTLQQTIGSIEQLGQQLDWSGVGGGFSGSIQQFMAKNFGTGSQQEQMLRSYIANLQATIAKERGGTSFTANEQALLEQYTPTINDSPLVIKSKLEALKSYLGGQIQTFGGGGGVNANDPLGIRFNQVGNTSASTPYLKTLGAVTGLNGSQYWAPGLDVDLKVGDPVVSPVSGKVIAAAPNGGFGNQVKIKTVDGKEVWLSHLDSGVVRVGQTIQAGQLIGYGGKTGKTIALGGGDGSHLDITIKDTNGKLLSAPQVKSYLDNIYV